jgi:hypothetical protein
MVLLTTGNALVIVRSAPRNAIKHLFIEHLHMGYSFFDHPRVSGDLVCALVPRGSFSGRLRLRAAHRHFGVALAANIANMLPNTRISAV